MTSLIGDDIAIEEMPQGCVITQTRAGKTNEIVVASFSDATMLIQSLIKMITIEYGKQRKEI